MSKNLNPKNVRWVIRKLAFIFWDKDELKVRAVLPQACDDKDDRKPLEPERKNALKGKAFIT